MAGRKRPRLEGSWRTAARLVARWLDSGDEAAFELLLWRHDTTVRGVCQHLLRRSQDIHAIRYVRLTRAGIGRLAKGNL